MIAFRKPLLCFLVLTVAFSSFAKEKDVPKYKNPALSVDVRVQDLLSRMTLEEKVGQLLSRYDKYRIADVKDKQKMEDLFSNMPGMLQPDSMGLERDIIVRNAIQHYALEKTRLGIPMLFVDEALHGAAKGEATSFPQAIAMGATWNPELVEKVFTTAAAELRSRGTHLVLTPVVDVLREPRWGRCEECYAEDPFLAGKMGAAAVRGFQGSADGTIAPWHVAATLKHYVGHGQKEGGRNKAPANIAYRLLRDIHIEPFRIAVRESQPRGVMPSYNEVDAVPMHMNRMMLRDVLRNELGFHGMMISDYQGIKELRELHQLSPNDTVSAELAFRAGVEFDLPNGDCFRHLVHLVKEGVISEQAIDEVAAKILRLKFEMGLFENPYVTLKEARRVAHDPSHAALAREVAQESIILLKNNDQLLPLDAKRYHNIAVIGHNGNDTRLGEYSGRPDYKVTILEGLRERFPDNNITYAEGSRIINGLHPDSRIAWFSREGPNTFTTYEQNRPLIDEAVEVASKADVVIMVLGENEMVCREAFAPTSTGDNSTLDLMGNQNELFAAVKALGKPIIVCLMHGRPLTINLIAKEADAILDLWYAGQETGHAVADIMSGDVCPSGHLTATYPHSIGQLPVWYNRKPVSARNYVNDPFSWLFPFGHGLSYTTFEYKDLQISDLTIPTTGSAKVTCTVSNTGGCDAYETVQLYIRQQTASVTRPIKELKGFKKIFLRAGESKQVSFEVGRQQLEYWNIDNHYAVEPSDYKLMIGRSSEDIRLDATLKVK